MPLPNGDLACVWFGGTQEGTPDVSIYVSRLAAGTSQWSQPVKLSDDPARSEQNPVLFPAPDGRLWLLWTAQISGNQDTAIVRRRISDDAGHSWGPIETMFDAHGTSGIFIRHPIAVLDNGEWLLPVYYCHGTPGVKWIGDFDASAVRISADAGTGAEHLRRAQLANGLAGDASDRDYRGSGLTQGGLSQRARRWRLAKPLRRREYWLSLVGPARCLPMVARGSLSMLDCIRLGQPGLPWPACRASARGAWRPRLRREHGLAQRWRLATSREHFGWCCTTRSPAKPWAR
jgi:hypothetical protein